MPGEALTRAPGFVDQIDGLIRQEAIRNVPARKIDGIADGFIV